MAEKIVNSNFHPAPATILPSPGDRKIELTYDPINGDTKLYLIVNVGGVQTKKSEIYKNGVWDPLSEINDPNEREKIHDKVKDKIKDIKKTTGTGVLPGFVVNNAGSQDIGVGGTIVPTGPQGVIPISLSILNAVSDPIGALTPFDVSGNKFEDKNEKRLFSESKLLIYPMDMITSKQDRLEIQQFRYKPTGVDALLKNPNQILQSGLQRTSPLSDRIGMVILPIPNGVSDGNNVSWGDDQMNNLSATAIGKAMNDMRTNLAIALGTGTIATALDIATKGQNPFGPLQAAKTAIAGAIYADVFRAAAASDGAKGDLSAGLTSQILKIAGFETSPESILARGFGIIPNSNLELLFNAPSLRQFSFAYRMSPRSKEEARNVKRIIRFFKQGMAPRKITDQGGQAGQASYFLGTPNVFKLKYKTTGNKSISGLNKFKVCALTSFSVNYAPEGAWSAYDEGQPVTLTMAMQFAELEPVYNTDYQTNIFNTRKDDLDPVEDDDVGY
jgi:hypothetical protein